MMKFCKNLAGPAGPTYGKLKKEITGWVKVGYYTN